MITMLHIMKNILRVLNICMGIGNIIISSFVNAITILYVKKDVFHLKLYMIILCIIPILQKKSIKIANHVSLHLFAKFAGSGEIIVLPANSRIPIVYSVKMTKLWQNYLKQT